MKSIIHRIMNHPEVTARPPVLVDIGASGALPTQWRTLAPYSICVAFDADSRDFAINATKDGEWAKHYAINRLVAAKKVDQVEFYLTQSPYCSSTLQPDRKSLERWAFYHLFDVERVVRLSAIDLKSALAMLDIDYIDWYKTDSQGTDLRIFAALPAETKEKVVAAEFEPGVIDAYLGEDKLHQVMAYMEGLPFWVSRMNILGSQRIDQEDLDTLNYLQRRSLGSFLKTAPGWCEISYVNTLAHETMKCREYLLSWTFASIKGEHGFAMRVARMGAEKFQEPLFGELSAFSRKSLSSGYVRGAGKFAGRVVRRITRSLTGRA